METAHIVEVGGRGGVYQHAVAVADAVAGTGVPVVLHTAVDAELEPPPAVRLCRCVRWWRGLKPGALRPPLIAATYVLGTLPHLARVVGRGGIYHFQGEFKSVLTTLGLMLQRVLPARRVVQSRHNTFSRHGGSLDERLMRFDARLCDATIVFTAPDEERVRTWGGRPVRSPLAQYVPPIPESEVLAWRRRWADGPGGPVVLFAGQVRADKRPDLLIEAAARMSPAPTVAVVGDDMAGEADRCRALAHRLGVDVRWALGYTPLVEFVAAMRAADVVVCPYDRASQSGVLAVARSVGAVTVATDVGGLAELANVAVRPDDAAELARGIERAHAAAGDPEPPLAETVAAAHRVAYGIDAAAGTGPG
jgi:glycosyltransferase involved in cell wall biosynthesis